MVGGVSFYFMACFDDGSALGSDGWLVALKWFCRFDKVDGILVAQLFLSFRRMECTVVGAELI